ncbi:hypothetical protein GCM10028791_42290 [Echinicola sediminis]
MTNEERVSALKEKLEGAPQSYQDARIKNLERMSFKDDDDFNGYLGDVSNDVKELHQMQANNKLKGFGGNPGRSQKEVSTEAEKEKVDKIVSSMMGLPPRKKANSENNSGKDQTTREIVKNLMK